MEAAGKENQKKSLFLLKKLVFFLGTGFGCPAEELYAVVGEWITSPAVGDICIT